MPQQRIPSANRRPRLPSVDVLRGLAVAGMILANNPGERGAVYAQLRHAAWHGLTVADGVFPLFLFLVGVSVTLSLEAGPRAAGSARRFWPRVLRRAGLLFALGLLENVYLRLSFESLRLPGVLQRIAVVYLAAAWLHRRLGNRGLAILAAVILVGYWLLLAWVPVPGLGRPSLDSTANLQGVVDQLVLGPHIWKAGTTWDPEGVLSSFPAVALGLVGVLAGRWLRGGGKGAARVAALGLGLLGGGLSGRSGFPSISRCVRAPSCWSSAAGPRRFWPSATACSTTGPACPSWPGPWPSWAPTPWPSTWSHRFWPRPCAT